MKSPITTHVLDTAQGRPAAGISVTLETFDSGDWRKLGQDRTDADGRISTLLKPDHSLEVGVYRLTFETAAYFAAMQTRYFYPYVTVVFEITDTAGHYHVPLLLNPFGYSTYRGS